jgi:hypothetical protein
LRPGDVWVIPPREQPPGHVRIISAVRNATMDNGTEVIEFETAESKGSGRPFDPRDPRSTQRPRGPVGRRWRTASRTEFHPIYPGGSSDDDSTFHGLL